VLCCGGDQGLLGVISVVWNYFDQRVIDGVEEKKLFNKMLRVESVKMMINWRDLGVPCHRAIWSQR
jgi:hypothetical protein